MTLNPVDALIPWLVFAAIIALLLRVQVALQHRIFGLGWLFSANKDTAAVIYTLVLLPGIFVHEFAEWVIAGVLNFKTTRSMRWPEADKNGELDPKFVTVDYPKRDKALAVNMASRLKDLFSRALVEITPTVAGLLLTLFISGSILELPRVSAALAKGQEFGEATGIVTGRPDFLLWVYVLFTISNSMMPRRFARRGIAIVMSVAAVFMIALALFGFSRVVEAWLMGPIPATINQFSTIFGAVLLLDLVVLVGVVALEAVMERTTQRQAPYKTAAQNKALAARQPRAPVVQIKSIHDYLVPIPSVADVMIIRTKAPKAVPTEVLREAPLELPRPQESPALSPPPARPALSPAPERPGLPEPRPAQPSMSPASTGSGGSGSSGGSPFGAPRPNTPTPAPAPRPDQGTQPMRPATAQPAAQQPATSGGSSFGGNRPASPASPNNPANVPAAANRPNVTPNTPNTQPVPGRPALPATTNRPPTANPPVPVNKPGMPTVNAPPPPGVRPSPFATNPARREDEIIDAEVIDDDDEPSFMKGVNSPKAPQNSPQNSSQKPPQSRPSMFGARPSTPFNTQPPAKKNEDDKEDDVRYEDVDDTP